MSLILLIVAAVLLYLAAFNFTAQRVQLGWLGLAIWCTALILPSVSYPTRFSIAAGEHHGESISFEGWQWIVVAVLVIAAAVIWYRRSHRGEPGPLSRTLSK